MMTDDESELLRRERLHELNTDDNDREQLELLYGQVWSTSEMQKDFEAIGFMAPLVVVRRKSDGVKGSLEFCHSPRFYFSWEEA